MEDSLTISHDGSKNWKAKIAVRITSIVLWSLTFFSMFFASLLISQVRENTEAEQKTLMDQLSYLVIQTIQEDNNALQQGFEKAASAVLKNEVIHSNMINFKIIDSGIGIKAEHIENFFNEFVQADDSTTREFGGSGLGLTICRRLSRLMGGDITATSEHGKGSIFIASLPLRTELIS